MRKEKDKMANFFEELKGNLESFGKTIASKTEDIVDVVARKTEDTVEVQKLKAQIRTMKRNNERDYEDIGKIVYERYAAGEEVDAEFVEFCEAIKEREKSIEDYEKQVERIKC